MAENLKHTASPLGPTSENGELSADVEETGLLISETMVFENWLKAHLSMLYQDVLGEPLPNELNEVVERFRANLGHKGSDRSPTTIASMSMTQLP